MNLGKVGEPYDYPDSFIQLLGYMRAYFHLPYRQTQGVVIAHASNKAPYIPPPVVILIMLQYMGARLEKRVRIQKDNGLQ